MALAVQKLHNPWLGLCEGSVSGHEEQGSVRSDLCTGTNSETIQTSQTSQGCGNLVLAPFHTTSGETSVCAPWTVAERASSTGICLANLTLNLGQAPISQQMVSLLGPGFA